MRNRNPARALIAALALVLALPGAGRAQSDLLFGTPHLETLAPGTTLVYAVTARRTDPETGVPADTEGTISLTVEPAGDPARRTVGAELVRDGRSRALPPFRGVSGNPVLIIFLEQITQDLARAAGGNPRYLRGRIRAGLGDGLTETIDGSVTRMTMHPLQADPQSAAMGPYANLEITFIVDTAVPGMFQALMAVAGPAEAPVFVEEVRHDSQD